MISSSSFARAASVARDLSTSRLACAVAHRVSWSGFHRAALFAFVVLSSPVIQYCFKDTTGV